MTTVTIIDREVIETLSWSWISESVLTTEGPEELVTLEVADTEFEPSGWGQETDEQWFAEWAVDMAREELGIGSFDSFEGKVTEIRWEDGQPVAVVEAVVVMERDPW